MVSERRLIDPYIGRSALDAAERATRFVQRALRARAAFFWSFVGEPATLIARAGRDDGIDADALAATFAPQALSARGAVALGAPCALGGVAVRASGGPHGVLFVADDAGRAFDADDLALIDDVAAGLARELEQDAIAGTTLPADAVPIPLDAFVRLSDALVRDGGASAALPPSDYLAAADRLDAVATRLRELAASGMRSARVDLSSQGADRESPSAHGDGAVILLADDLDLNRKLISDMLTVEGHQVDCVADGASALAAVQAKAYDLVLMDMIMPGMDGIAATRAIRALPAPACQVPIVALTANTFKEQLDSCLQAGMDATLTKPMSFEALTDVVAAWTSGRTVAA